MKFNKTLILFIKSTLIVATTSALISTAIWMLGGNFLAAFLLSSSVQYVLFSFFGNLINNYYSQITKQKELDKLEQLSTILECAYCKRGNIITFIPDENERVEFICTDCEKKNLVNINFTVARITEPLIMDNIPNAPTPLKNQ